MVSRLHQTIIYRNFASCNEVSMEIFRAVAVVLLVLAVALPASLYVLLSMTPVQNEVRNTASANSLGFSAHK